MEIHDEVSGFGVPVANFALVAVRVVGHFVLLEGQIWRLVTRLGGDRHLISAAATATAAGAATRATAGTGRRHTGARRDHTGRCAGARRGHAIRDAVGSQGGHHATAAGVHQATDDVVVERRAIVVVGEGRAGGVLARPAGRGLPAHVAVVLVAFVLVQLPAQRLEHGQVRVAVHAQPVLGVVDVDQVPDELVVRLADQAALALVGAEDHVVVERVVDHREAQVLQVHSDLVHAARVGFAQHHARIGSGVEAQLLEGGGALLAPGRHLAHADLVGHHLNRFRAGDLLFGKVALYAADVLLGHLPVSDLVLHLAGLFG